MKIVVCIKQVPARDSQLRVASSGAWGAKDKPGSGRFTYVDTEPIGGVIAELLWNFR